MSGSYDAYFFLPVFQTLFTIFHSNMSHFPQPDLEAALQLDYLECAHALERVFAARLKPAPDGIYVKHEIEPVIVAGTECYVRDPHSYALERVLDINGVREAIRDKQGNVLITRSTMLNAAKWVSNTPFVPYRGAKIVELMIKRHIAKYVAYGQLRGKSHLGEWFVPYTAHTNWDAHIAEHFDFTGEIEAEAPIYLWDYERASDELAELFLPMVRQLNAFLGNHVWNIYHVHLTTQLLRVDRYTDWRAYEWTKSQWLSENPETE